MKTLLRLRIFTTSFVALFVFAGLLFSEGHKKVDPFSIDVTALQGQDAIDVYATFSTSVPVNYPLPSSIKKFQIKISKVKGGVSFISNQKDVDLVNNQIVTRIPGRFENSALRVVADIKTPQKGDVELVKELVDVKLRPDLTVASFSPTEWNINLTTPLIVTVVVEEINGQSSSTFSVSLYQEGSLIETKTDVAVAAGGNVSVDFVAPAHSTVGGQNYSVVISDVDPADYNTANNTEVFSINFVSLVKNYHFEYSRLDSVIDSLAVTQPDGSHIYNDHTQLREENFIYRIFNNDPPIITGTLVSAAYVIERSDGSKIQGSFTDVNPDLDSSDAFRTVYYATDFVNNLVFRAERDSNGVSSSIELHRSNTVYYFDQLGYTEYYILGDDITSFLNENTSFVVSLVTSIGDYSFGGGASIGIDPLNSTSGLRNLTYNDSFWGDFSSSVQWSVQKGTTYADGVTDPTILPSASQRNEAKITLKSDDGGLPKEFKLNQNYPNPFNPTTIITFALPKSAFVSVKVYDVLGREVKTLLSDEMSAGIHAVEWRGDDNGGTKASSGIYLYRITAADFVSTKKMILMK